MPDMVFSTDWERIGADPIVIGACPGFLGAVDPLFQAIVDVFDATQRTSLRPEVAGPLSLVALQAHNDFSELLILVVAGRGRSALRSSRTLYELAVAAHEVTDPTKAARYFAHAPVAMCNEITLKEDINLLPKKAANTLRHLRKKRAVLFRNAAAPVLAAYGDRFRFSWASGKFSDRATATALGSFYPFYQLTSSLLHGAASGERGITTSGAAHGVPVLHIIGKDYVSSALAFPYAARFYREILSVLAAEGVDAAVIDAAYVTLGAVASRYPELREALRLAEEDRLDGAVPRGEVAVAKIVNGDLVGWFAHDRAAKVVREAEPAYPLAAVELDSLPHDGDGFFMDMLVRLRYLPGSAWMPEASEIPEECLLAVENRNSLRKRKTQMP